MHRSLQRYTPRQRKAVIAAMAAPTTPRPLAKLRLLCVPYGVLSHLRCNDEAANILGEHKVVFRPGCFADSLNGYIPLRAQHDGGRQLNGAELTFYDRPDGLYADVSLPYTALARQVLRNVSYGVYKGVSISEQLGDNGIHKVWGSKNCQILDIQKTNLIEISIVDDPSFSDTFVSLV